MKYSVSALMAGLLLSMGVCSMASDSRFEVRVVDPLVKLLQDAPAPAGKSPNSIRIDAVRNEYESGQIIVTANGKIEKLTAKAGPVTGPDGPKPRVKVQFVGYVPVMRGTTGTPPEHLVAKGAGSYPDPLLESSSVSVEPGKTQSIWITVYVPKGAVAGSYKGSIEVTADGASRVVPLEITVHPFTLPDARTLHITNWYSPHNLAKAHGVEVYSEAYWKWLEVWARFMADYRQDTIITHIIDLIKGNDDGNGNLTFDFSRFDRYVEIFKRAGVIGIIEGGHIAGRNGPWDVPDFRGYYPRIAMPDGSMRKNPEVNVTSEEYKLFLSQFLPALQKHLEDRCWLDHYVQHLTDEPIPENAESYKKAAAYIREFAPKLRIIDASMCDQIAGAIDIWVPQPPEFEKKMQFFRDREKAGDTVWFYTCLSPKGKYMNRFIDYPLLDARLMHWVNFKYDLPGYLHWGFNYWQGANAFADLEPNWGGDNYLPPGDSHIVYPGKKGPMSSIRLEAMRDGIEDYELLRLLEKKNPRLAREICDSTVRSLTDYTLAPAEFRKARGRLLAALVEEEG